MAMDASKLTRIIDDKVFFLFNVVPASEPCTERNIHPLQVSKYFWKTLFIVSYSKYIYSNHSNRN